MNAPPITARDLPSGRLDQRADAAAREVRRPTRRARSRRLIIAVAISTAVVGGPLAAVALRVVRGSDSKPETVALRSFDRSDRAQLQEFLGPGMSATRIAANGRIAYYVVRGPHGVCLTSGPFRSGRPTAGSSECVKKGDEGALLPSAKRPLVLDDTVSMDPAIGSRSMTFTAIGGLTAGGVARVVAVGKSGRALLTVPVIGRIFEIPPTALPSVYALIAETADGSPIGPKQPIPGRS